jgi:hypothetical protein
MSLLDSNDIASILIYQQFRLQQYQILRLSNSCLICPRISSNLSFLVLGITSLLAISLVSPRYSVLLRFSFRCLRGLVENIGIKVHSLRFLLVCYSRSLTCFLILFSCQIVLRSKKVHWVWGK